MQDIDTVTLNQLSFMARKTQPDLVSVYVSSDSGKWHVIEGSLMNQANETEAGFGRVINVRNSLKNYATLDSLLTDLLRACNPYSPNLVFHLEGIKQ